MTENELYDLLEELDLAKDELIHATQWYGKEKQDAAHARWSAITERIRFKLGKLVVDSLEHDRIY
jgi:hypothetical protein